jgi:hypothetical protein
MNILVLPHAADEFEDAVAHYDDKQPGLPELPGVMVYGTTREEAVARVKALALRVLADRLEHGETVPELVEAFSVGA